MPRLRALLVVCTLLLVAGCLGGVAEPSPTPSATATPSTTATPSATATPSPTATPSTTATQSVEAIGEQAITAEQRRIERRAADYGTLTDLSFGILEPAEYEVIRQNSTALVVRVDVGYSVSLDCDGDGRPDSSVDGANTVATYSVTDDRARLLEVSQEFLDPAGYC